MFKYRYSCYVKLNTKTKIEHFDPRPQYKQTCSQFSPFEPN